MILILYTLANPAACAALALPTGRTTAVRQNLRGMRSLNRFTEFGIRYMLKDDYTHIDIEPIDETVGDFPAVYRTIAREVSS